MTGDAAESPNAPESEPDLLIEFAKGDTLDSGRLDELSKLFSEHYGLYSTSSPVGPGRRVRLSPERIRTLLADDASEVWSARIGGELIGYALAVRAEMAGHGIVTWITQLVVREDYRHRGVAGRLLSRIWSFSDHFAWGLVSSNPYAVRALEKATRRRCDPRWIVPFRDELRTFGSRRIEYIRLNHGLAVDDTRSVIDTRFFVDHSELGEMIRNASTREPWRLGELGEGEEWFAFTVRPQDEFPLTRQELDRVLADADTVVRRAYQGMTLDHQHAWTRHTPHETDFLIRTLGLAPGDMVLDFGCGTGRHSLELARRGISVLGIDFVPNFIEKARDVAAEEGLADLARFETADCRSFPVPQLFDAGLCLYDVIGSFPDNVENQRIIDRLAAAVRPGGRILASVLNLVMTEAIAKHKVDIYREPQALLDLKPSRTMQQTGDIFDPDLFILDPTSGIVYRKEQFAANAGFPHEVIVRDRRYRREELEAMFARAAVVTEWVRHVRAGRWNEESDPTKAKEILFLGHKS